MERAQQTDDTGEDLDAELGGITDEIADVVRALRRAVDAKVGLDCSFEKRERATLKIGNEAKRQLLEEELQSIAEAHGRELLIGNVLYRHHKPGERAYASLCGLLQISRSTYRLAGVRSGPTVVPLDLQAGLMEGATPAMAYRVALGYAKGHSRSLEEDLRASHNVPPSRTRLEKTSKRLGAKSKTEAHRIEAVLRQAERLPDGAIGISVGLDRTAVPMEELRPDGATPNTERKRRDKPYVRTPPPPVDVNYRMAYIGTVSITDQYGDGLIVRRYAATPEQGPEEVLHGMMADVRNALRRNPHLRVGVVQDGAPEMWNLIRPALKQIGVATWLEAIDRYHLNERLAKVLKVIEPNPEVRKAQLHQWNVEFDYDNGTIDRIEQRIASANQNPNDQGGGDVLQDNATFIRNNKERMRFVALREASLPVGSGTTEGACRYVVGDRAKRSSRRWHEDGLAAALTLRSIYCSDRLRRFFSLLQQSYTAEIREADSSESAVA